MSKNKKEAQMNLYYMNQGGAVSTCTFYVNVLAASPYVINRGETETTSECVINVGEEGNDQMDSMINKLVDYIGLTDAEIDKYFSRWR